DEYDAHIREKRCPAHECAALRTYVIDGAKCIGCTACARKCPAAAISGELKKPHAIDASKCVGCAECMKTCRFGAVSVK
ncbi:MAG: 4Fe-4S binding protein, partial [Kiritimatiellae bacterium]|nr:4Fe-4S binding protein [Kiritimatiellia bacterium]